MTIPQLPEPLSMSMLASSADKQYTAEETRAHGEDCYAAGIENAGTVPPGLLDRVKAAEQRVHDNRAPRSIPADPRSDVDLVLAEVCYWLEGKWPPFWIAIPTSSQRDADQR